MTMVSDAVAEDPSSMEITVRPAHEGDVDAIACTHVACWDETYRGVLPDVALDRQTVETRRSLWSRLLGDPAQCIFVVEVDSAVVGFASANANDEPQSPYDAFLDTLYVRTSAQGKGLARRLLSAVAREMLARGFHGMALVTLRDRNAACAFYERMGALLVREQPAPPIIGEGIMDRVYAFPDLRVLVVD
jgi:GNAT superfamily N-acetyltransferase